MTAKKRSKLEAEAAQYLKDWIEVLGLQGWTVTLKTKDLGSDVPERTMWADFYRKATMYLNNNPAGWGDEVATGNDLSRTVLHGLVHLHLAPISDRCHALFKGSLLDELNNDIETCTDNVVNAIWRTLDGVKAK